MKHIAGLVMAAVLGTALAVPAVAQDGNVVSEVRLGVSAYDAYPGFIPLRLSEFDLGQVENVNFEVLFHSPRIDAFRWIGSPRPVMGTTLNLDGGVSIAYGGLNWHLPLFDTPFYLEGTFGAAANNGSTAYPPKSGTIDMGCNFQFYENAGIGANLSDNVTATVTYEHTSNAGLCSWNHGLTNVGVRLGWKF